MMRFLASIALMFLALPSAAGQENAASQLSVERIFDSEDFEEQRLRSARCEPNSRSICTPRRLGVSIRRR